MTLALLVLRRDRAFVASDSAAFDSEGNFRCRANGVPVELEKLHRVANGVMLVRGHFVLLEFLLQRASSWQDVDAAIKGTADALKTAQHDAGLGAADYSRPERLRLGEVNLVGYSATRGCIVAAQFSTVDKWATFETQLIIVEDREDVTRFQAPYLPTWENYPVNTVQDIAAHVRAQFAHDASLDEARRDGCFGGKIVCAELIRDGVRLSTLGDLGYPTRAIAQHAAG